VSEQGDVDPLADQVDHPVEKQRLGRHAGPGVEILA
jgi:hypothetical protein